MSKKFTLIELLVVLAIIGILASLLMPSLSKAKHEAIFAVCKNNMKQLAVANTMYVDDYEFLPHSSWGAEVGQGTWLYTRESGSPWDDKDVTTGTFWQYLSTKAVYQCPAHSDRSVDPGVQNATSYHMSPLINYNPDDYWAYDMYHSPGEFESDLVLLWEPNESRMMQDASGSIDEGLDDDTYMTRRHMFTKSNMAFIDGSVLSVRRAEYAWRADNQNVQ